MWLSWLTNSQLYYTTMTATKLAGVGRTPSLFWNPDREMSLSVRASTARNFGGSSGKFARILFSACCFTCYLFFLSHIETTYTNATTAGWPARCGRRGEGGGNSMVMIWPVLVPAIQRIKCLYVCLPICLLYPYVRRPSVADWLLVGRRWRRRQTTFYFFPPNIMQGCMHQWSWLLMHYLVLKIKM